MEKINSFNLNILLNIQFGRYFLLHFVLNPIETTSVGHYTCNTKHEPLRHQEITPSVMTLIWNLFQIGFPIQWLKIINSSQFSGGVTYHTTGTLRQPVLGTREAFMCRVTWVKKQARLSLLILYKLFNLVCAWVTVIQFYVSQGRGEKQEGKRRGREGLKFKASLPYSILLQIAPS